MLILSQISQNCSMRKPCCDKQEMNKGAWSKQEDQKLIDYIQKHGEGKWRFLPQAAGLLRCGKSCRLRWVNYLRPDLKRGNFAEDEEDLIIKLHALLGNRWSLIAGRLPGRTDNEVKNYWNTHLRRKLLSMGVNPENHRIHHHSILQPQFKKSFPEQDDRLSCAITSSPVDEKLSSEEVPADLNLRLAASTIPGEEMTEDSVFNNDKEDNAGKSCTTLLLFK